MSYSDDTAEYLFTGEPSLATLRQNTEMTHSHSCEECGKKTKLDQLCFKCRTDQALDWLDE